MGEIHYTDAILTVLFASGVAFMLWSVREFMKINLALARSELQRVKDAKKSTKRIARLERNIAKQIIVANAEGAKIVRDYFDTLNQRKGKNRELAH